MSSRTRGVVEMEERTERVTMCIRRNSDGAVSEHSYTVTMKMCADDAARFDRGGPSDFLYTEGNYSCDCNRFLFFELGQGREPDACRARCGNSAYTYLWVDVNGVRVVQENVSNGA